MNTGHKKLSDVGEKIFIRDFIKPFFNAEDDPGGVGDDCAMIPFGDELALVSTDRVPADLTAYRYGILDHYGLGDYTARLNLSDIAACGGTATGLLLNLGLPNDIEFDRVQELCRGFKSCAERHGARVLGGDMTNAAELSISATSIGRVAQRNVLTRRGARPGDSIFISRPIGTAHAALRVLLAGLAGSLSASEQATLKLQFTAMEPMFALGHALGSSGECGACMDNTDGVGQCLTELSEASQCAFVVHVSSLRIPPIVERVCHLIEVASLEILFDAGCDFSLVGTIRGRWTSEAASSHVGHPLEIIGHVEKGHDIWLECSDKGRKPLLYRGWNYFSKESLDGKEILNLE